MTDIASRLRQYDQSYPPSILEPDPRVVSLSPATVSAAAGATTVTVTGENFTATSVVEVNQVAQPTTFVNATSLTISYDPTAAGTTMFSVRDGSGESNSVPFNVTALAAEDVTAPEPEPPQPQPPEQPEPSEPEQPQPEPESEPADPWPGEPD